MITLPPSPARSPPLKTLHVCKVPSATEGHVPTGPSDREDDISGALVRLQQGQTMTEQSVEATPRLAAALPPHPCHGKSGHLAASTRLYTHASLSQQGLLREATGQNSASRQRSGSDKQPLRPRS